MLQGARQVGKTYLLKTFGGSEYKNLIYINFEEDSRASSLFEGPLKASRLIANLRIYSEQDIQSEDTLIFLDEIQACPNALTSLKYFCEQARDFHIVSAGSLLGVKLQGAKSFPVGKVNFMNLYPMSFFEFLDAVERPGLRQLLESQDGNMPIENAFHLELLELLKRYLLVGGMPEAVSAYREADDVREARQVQREIIKAFALDFSKHAPASEVMKLSAIWESIPSQLAKENKKFVFSAIRKSARAREYESAIQWLDDAGLVIRAQRISTPKFPLAGYCDHSAYKLFMLDVGLLTAMSEVPARNIFEPDKLFVEFRGSLAENFVAQEIRASHNSALYYWASEGKAEVDFVIPFEGKIYPLEVKAGSSRKKKSLLVYADKFSPPILSRASSRNLRHDGNLLNYPLYLVSRFPDLSSR